MTPGQARIQRWRADPVAFVRECFGAEPDPWQIDALAPLGGSEWRHRRAVAAKACTGPGKTTWLAWAGWHRLVCFGDRGEHPKGAAISGEGRDNLRDNLWSELAKWRERSDALRGAFTWTKELIFANDHPETWFLSARSYARDADEEAIGRSLSGLHSRFPFVLLDEIGDAPHSLGKKAAQIFTGGVTDAALCAAGNPTSLSGLLYRIATAERDAWEVITITGDPDDPKAYSRAARFGPEVAEHAREQIRLYGREDPWVMATILGQFPPADFQALLGVSEVEAAMERHVTEDAYAHAQKRLGVDAARFGDDPWVIFPRQGLVAFQPVVMRGPRSHDVAARIAMARAKWGQEVEFLDDTGGYAAGAIDSMIQGGMSPVPVNFAGRADDPRHFNKRSEILFRCAEWVKRGGCLPRVPALVREMTEVRYSFQNGKFRVEEKEQVKRRLGFSTNYFDALALTFSWAEMPAATNHPRLLPESARVVTADTQESARRGPEPRLTVLRDGDPFA